MSDFVKSKIRVHLTPGDFVRISREMMELTQTQMAKKTGIPQPTISAIESNKVAIGVERAKKFALVLKVHPGMILFPQWEGKKTQVS